jgi:hypothetical protein
MPDNEKKQTAVQWLQELYNSRPDYEQFITIEEFQQALKMENMQIMKAHIDGQSLVNCKDEYAENYYNETYGS